MRQKAFTDAMQLGMNENAELGTPCRRGESSSVNNLTILSCAADYRDKDNSKGRSPDKDPGPVGEVPTLG